MRLSKESLEFLVEFFKVLQSKNLKTDSQLLDILETYTDWDSSSGNLTLIDVPDELKDRFENFLKHIVIITKNLLLFNRGFLLFVACIRKRVHNLKVFMCK